MRKKENIPFEEVILFFNENKILNTHQQWRKFCLDGKRPSNIPTNLKDNYGKHALYNDWLLSLKSSRKLTRSNRYRSLDEVSVFIKKFNIKNTRNWRLYCSSGEKPKDIPRTLEMTYKNLGWTTSFFKNNILETPELPVKNKYPTYKTLKKIVSELDIKNSTEWRKYSKSKFKHEWIPTRPDTVYKHIGWTSWPDFLENVKSNDKLSKNFVDYKTAKKYLEYINIRDQRHYHTLHSSKVFKIKIPRNPYRYYKKNNTWVSWNHFLNLKGIENFGSGEDYMCGFISKKYSLVKSYKSKLILGNQHLDVYIYKHMIGVEYQGEQHFKPVDFFGGQKSYDKIKERDQRKRDACEKHGIKLFYFSYDVSYVPEDYPYKVYSDEQELLQAINDHIQEQKLSKQLPIAI